MYAGLRAKPNNFSIVMCARELICPPMIARLAEFVLPNAGMFRSDAARRRCRFGRSDTCRCRRRQRNLIFIRRGKQVKGVLNKFRDLVVRKTDLSEMEETVNFKFWLRVSVLYPFLLGFRDTAKVFFHPAK